MKWTWQPALPLHLALSLALFQQVGGTRVCSIPCVAGDVLGVVFLTGIRR